MFLMVEKKYTVTRFHEQEIISYSYKIYNINYLFIICSRKKTNIK